MILETQQSTVQTYGDVETFKASIDTGNLDVITTLLSSSLYSNPEKSFLRETVSNAWDSEVEAGTTDQPIIISFDDSKLTIRDYGTGLSPERFKDIYVNIGSSTKRETNDYIGAFGIGKYASLACSDFVYINSYYNGKKYMYIMNKNAGIININRLAVFDTTEKNGLEIAIDITGRTRYRYEAQISSLRFFPNIYVKWTDQKVNNINGSHIRKAKYFKESEITSDEQIVIGNVLYSANAPACRFSSSTQHFLSKIKGTGIALSFDIGELDVTPNREELIFNDRTVKAIEQRASDAQDEILDMIKSHVYKDYDNLESLWHACTQTYSFSLFEDISSRKVMYVSSSSYYDPSKITYHGISVPEDVLAMFFTTVMPFAKFVVMSKGLCSVNIQTRPWMYRMENIKKLVIVNGKITGVLKKYLYEYYKDYIVSGNFTEAEFQERYLQIIPHIHTEEFKTYMHIFYKHIMSIAEILDPGTDRNFQDYKRRIQNEKNSDPQKGKDPVTINMVTGRELESYRQKFQSLDDGVRFIKEYGKGVYIISAPGKVSDDEKMLAQLALQLGYKVCSVNKCIKPLIIQALGSYYVSPEKLIKSKHIPVLAAIMKCFDEYIYGDLNDRGKRNLYCVKLNSVESYFPFYDTLTKEDSTRIREYSRIYFDIYYSTSLQDWLLKQENVDSETALFIRSTLLKLSGYVKCLTVTGISYNCIPTDNMRALVNFVILKNKEYRLSYRGYKMIKDNQLTGILCKK